MNILRKLFCRHKNSEVICWHWTHGINSNDYNFLEIQEKCNLCGRYYFKYIRDRNECDEFVKKYPEKQWYKDVKPV